MIKKPLMYNCKKGVEISKLSVSQRLMVFLNNKHLQSSEYIKCSYR